MSIDIRDKIFLSLDNFLEFISNTGKKDGYSLKEMFKKGLDGTLQIRHETKKAYRLRYSLSDLTRLRYSLSELTTHWAGYKLSPFPGCCGIVVSFNAFIDKDYQGYGLGQWFHQQRLTLMKVLGYSCAMCTVTSDNDVEKHILTKNGWKSVHSFKNSRTGNTVEIWVKDL